jgi:hypothetical protein
VHPNAAASAKAATVDGTRRPVSIALMPARDSPERRASSSCDQPNRLRNDRTEFSSIDHLARIRSNLDTIVSGMEMRYNHGLATMMSIMVTILSAPMR